MSTPTDKPRTDDELTTSQLEAAALRECVVSLRSELLASREWAAGLQAERDALLLARNETKLIT